MTHPLTPPPELVQQWAEQAPRYRDGGVGREVWLINRAYSAGADEELEALLVWLCVKGFDNLAADLLAARRPKPPSLKEQALEMLESAWEGGHINNNAAQVIRRALEALPND
jgi:hypothetical protein